MLDDFLLVVKLLKLFIDDTQYSSLVIDSLNQPILFWVDLTVTFFTIVSFAQCAFLLKPHL